MEQHEWKFVLYSKIVYVLIRQIDINIEYHKWEKVSTHMFKIPLNGGRKQ